MKKLTYTLTILLISIQFTQAQFWEYVATIPDTASIYCISINQNGVIFIGTSGQYVQGGVYRSTNNGGTWLFSELTSPLLTVYSILALEDNQTVFAGTSDPVNINRTIDEGVNWSANFDTGFENAISLFEDSNHNIFAGTYAIYKSIDNGDSWELKAETKAIYDYAETSNGYLYAATWDFLNYLENGVYRSTDGGDNWEFIDIADDGFTALAVNSNDEIFAASFYEGLFISDDYGETWIQKPVYTINDLFIDNNDVLYVTTENYGVHRSFNKGDTWENISSGLSSSSHDQFALSPDGHLYLIPGLHRSIEPVSVHDVKKNNNIEIYPNPASDFIKISFQQSKQTDIKIYNAHGKLIDVITTKNLNYTEYPVNSLSTGIYFIELINQKQTIIKKIIVAN